MGIWEWVIPGSVWLGSGLFMVGLWWWLRKRPQFSPPSEEMLRSWVGCRCEYHQHRESFTVEAPRWAKP